MTSFFRTQFDSAFPINFGQLSDANVSLVYTDSAGAVSSAIVAIWRGQSTELREDGFGNLINVTLGQAVISKDDLVTIDLEGSFVRDGVTWDIDTLAEGTGVESTNETFSVVHLVSRTANTQSPAGRRV